jgi:hypothetical protein
MIRYVFRDRPNTIKGKADAQKIGEALDKIKQATPGRCNSRTFLNAARDKSNYLHRHLEWDDKIAGEKYRLQQIRELVSCIDIIDDSDKNKRQLPAFISLIERQGRGYHTAREVMDSATLQDIALRQAEADLAAYEKRLAQFVDICTAIRAARELIAERRAKYDRRKGREDRPGA